MNPDQAARNLEVIRQLMERPVRYSTQSGLAAIFAGCVTLVGMAADWYFFCRFGPGHQAFWANMFVWAGVFLLALAGTLGLTRWREIRQGMPFWTPAKRKLLVTIIAPFIASVGLTTAIAANWYLKTTDTGELFSRSNQWGLIVPCWMIFYGLACWQVSQYSTREIGILGAAFIAAGLVSATFFQTCPYWTVGVTFGGFHIVYGVYVWVRYGG